MRCISCDLRNAATIEMSINVLNRASLSILDFKL